MSEDDDYPVVLTIGGSDSSGGAGIQADLKTFCALGVYGTSAITAVTAQVPNLLSGITPIDPHIVRQQIRTVCTAMPVRVAKTGMLYSAEIIRQVTAADVRQGIPILVVDPVMVSASGAKLLEDDAVEAMTDILLPEARVVTPNLQEAEILAGCSINSVDDLIQAAKKIGDKYDVACVAKGGHLEGAEVVDVLYDEGEEYVFSAPRVFTEHTHGAGCAFSAALTACLAHRQLMEEAVENAKEYVRSALEHAHHIAGFQPLNFFWDVPADG